MSFGAQKRPVLSVLAVDKSLKPGRTGTIVRIFQFLMIPYGSFENFY